MVCTMHAVLTQTCLKNARFPFLISGEDTRSPSKKKIKKIATENHMGNNASKQKQPDRGEGQKAWTLSSLYLSGL